VEDQVAASTQNIARSALLFLYRDVPDAPLPPLGGIAPAKRPERLPVVFTRAEVKALLRQLYGTPLLMASLLYGGGLRLMECVRLRVKDIDLPQGQITVRDGKGGKDRLTVLPQTVLPAVRQQLTQARQQYEQDLTDGHANVYLPDALARKYPQAPANGPGNGCSPPAPFPPTRAPALSAVTIWAKKPSSAPSKPRSKPPASPSTAPAIPCATRSPPT
jgi:integrase